MPDDLAPWEQQPGETSRAYAAFRQFRDLGIARRVLDVAGTRATLNRWAHRYRWFERAHAWDAEAYRVEDARRLDAIRQMDETHRQIARALVAAGLETLATKPQLTPHQAARVIDLGTRLERAALLGDRLPPPAPINDGPGDELSPLERIARELAGTA